MKNRLILISFMVFYPLLNGQSEPGERTKIEVCSAIGKDSFKFVERNCEKWCTDKGYSDFEREVGCKMNENKPCNWGFGDGFISECYCQCFKK